MSMEEASCGGAVGKGWVGAVAVVGKGWAWAGVAAEATECRGCNSAIRGQRCRPASAKSIH